MNYFDPDCSAAPIASAARTHRAIASKPTVRNGFRRLRWWLRRQLQRFALARQRRGDMDLLLRTDDRMLKDIGLTHGQVRAADVRGWRL
ncbi:DUF1127 domain-containing protein [Allomesorhizobium alhagi]|jgi:uncharacterized protein YjiS (DUF1127 family)|uniref:YjiS-like domain-containing protein n=1 Tax=Mesorhizobium alhagi CCNWXJ12-2 TaxID=1107882 RepID=H0HJG4_9HYPH|nr:DUF1127 domain-containing protein [Mesorhizobium alhagi]EHK59129.1 hypothetical protein MAXJ12_01344 [Mesorhizobium alhagi CCNWXJ12-2]